MGDGSDDSPFEESGSSLLALEFQNVAKKLVEHEQEMKQKYLDLKKKYEDDQHSYNSKLKQKENEIVGLKKVNLDLKRKYEDGQQSHTLELKQKENEIVELKKVNLEYMKRIKIYEKRFLLLDERVFILEETARDLKCGILENNNNNNNNSQQKDFAASAESSIGLPLSNKKRDPNKRTKPRLQEIIEIDDDDDDDFQCISTLKRKRDSNEVKKEHNSDDNDLDHKSTLTTSRVKEMKRDRNSYNVDKIPTGTQSRRNVGELHSHQLTSQALYSPHSEVKPNILASPFNTNRSTSGQDGNKVDEVYMSLAAKLKIKKDLLESEATMLKEFEKNDELSMNAICALYRQRTKMNIHDQSDLSRINQLASLLFDGDSQKNLRRTSPELDLLDLHDIQMLAKKYSAPIFNIYQKKIDPFFRPRG